MLDTNYLVHIFMVFIKYDLEYGDTVWSNCTKTESADRIVTVAQCISSIHNKL
jgi:hypothetical protein